MRFLLLLLLMTATVFQSRAQNVSDAAINAFSASYQAESRKDYAQAIQELRPAYQQDFYEVNLRLGWLYWLQKDYANSEKFYRQAIAVRPGSIEAMLGFVNPAAALAHWVEVFKTYQAILKIDPQHSVANYRIALMYFYRKEYAAAEKHLQTAVDHYPFDYDIVLLMAQTKLALGKTGDSKKYYQRALLYNPDNDEIKKVLGKL